MNITSLFNKCAAFAKMAFSGHSVKKNKHPLLKSLSDAKDFEDAVEIADEQWEKLGEGSARAVYKLSDKLIIKIAINEKGISQNLSEMSFEAQCDCVAKVLLADGKGKWLIMQFTESVSDDQFTKLVGCSLKTFSNALFYAFNNESDDFTKPRDYDTIKKLPLFQCLGKVIMSENSLIGDWSKLSSYGELNGKILVRDYGFSKHVHDLHYST
jgi:hypothetical protein